MMTKLTRAFKNKNKSEILFLAADLAHYIGDAHMPLHTTINHDGQLTGQKGIHALWESYLPEKFGNKYNFYTRNAVYINDVTSEIWRIIENSHSLVDSVLIIQRRLNSQFTADQVYQKDSNGNMLKNKFNQSIYSLAYAAKYHEMLNGMVENQLKLSITASSDFWYTAWVNGGKPNLTDLDPESLTERNVKNYKNEIKLWKKGKLFGLKTGNEF
jgi:hypothetical protein